MQTLVIAAVAIAVFWADQYTKHLIVNPASRRTREP